jgi:glycosyltransferase involved in cell wall biosynthesis
MATELHTPSISVLVSTYNRAESLRRCLAALEALSVPDGLVWEVVVVDNDSDDDTRETIAGLQRKSRIQIVYVYESRQGKSHALNQGVARSQGQIVAFIDDDCMVDKNWLVCLSEEFDNDAALSGLGGRVELYDPQDKPVSVRTSRRRRDLGLVNLFSLVPGCNMAFRRAALEKVGAFDGDFGPGTRLVVEDIDFIYRALKCGCRIVYSPDLLVFHNHGRRSDEQMAAVNHGYLMGRGAFYCKHILNGDVAILRLAYWEYLSLLKSIAKNVIGGKQISDEWAAFSRLLSGMAYELVNRSRRWLQRNR